MPFQVLSIRRKQHEILDAIVRGIPIDMVNNFLGREESIQVPFHDQPVFIDISFLVAARVMRSENQNMARPYLIHPAIPSRILIPCLVSLLKGIGRNNPQVLSFIPWGKAFLKVSAARIQGLATK